jgi:hypothetical protein
MNDTPEKRSSVIERMEMVSMMVQRSAISSSTFINVHQRSLLMAEFQ